MICLLLKPNKSSFFIASALPFFLCVSVEEDPDLIDSPLKLLVSKDVDTEQTLSSNPALASKRFLQFEKPAVNLLALLALQCTQSK